MAPEVSSSEEELWPSEEELVVMSEDESLVQELFSSSSDEHLSMNDMLTSVQSKGILSEGGKFETEILIAVRISFLTQWVSRSEKQIHLGDFQVERLLVVRSI